MYMSLCDFRDLTICCKYVTNMLQCVFTSVSREILIPTNLFLNRIHIRNYKRKTILVSQNSFFSITIFRDLFKFHKRYVCSHFVLIGLHFCIFIP